MTRVGSSVGRPEIPRHDASTSPPASKKGQGRENDPAMKAAKLLESLFVRQFIQAMGKGSSESSALFGKSVGRDIFQQMFKGAVADEIYDAGGLGLADQIVDQLRAGAQGSPVSVPRSLAAISDVPPALATSSPPAGQRSSAPRALLVSEAKSPQKVSELGARRAVAAHEQAAALRRTVQRQRARRVLGEHRALGGIAFEAPARRRFILPKDADGKLHHPLGIESPTRLSSDGALAAPAGARVVATASGRIVAREADGLVIDHGGGLRSVYRGLGEVSAQVGDIVLRDQEIGRVGRSGAIQFSAKRGGRDLEAREINGEYFSQ